MNLVKNCMLERISGVEWMLWELWVLMTPIMKQNWVFILVYPKVHHEISACKSETTEIESIPDSVFHSEKCWRGVWEVSKPQVVHLRTYFVGSVDRQWQACQAYLLLKKWSSTQHPYNASFTVKQDSFWEASSHLSEWNTEEQRGRSALILTQKEEYLLLTISSYWEFLVVIINTSKVNSFFMYTYNLNWSLTILV